VVVAGSLGCRGVFCFFRFCLLLLLLCSSFPTVLIFLCMREQVSALQVRLSLCRGVFCWRVRLSWLGVGAGEASCGVGVGGEALTGLLFRCCPCRSQICLCF